MAGALTGKVAVITGGATGIGRAVARLLAAEGVQVVITGRDQARGKAVAAELSGEGCQTRYIRSDVRIENSIGTLFDQTIDLFGRLDLLFNNAGYEGVLGPIDENPVEIVDDVLAINVKGVFLCMKQVLPHLIRRGGGIIVNTSSFLGTVLPFPDAVLLGATEAAVVSMTQSVAAGYSDRNINVYAVCPWLTETPMLDRITLKRPEARTRLACVSPSGQLCTPDDVANVVLSMFRGNTEFASGDAVLVDHGGTTQKIRPMSA
jgi:NAD(P)-dependent dehydrogenase (short-subunit alcohol dehydrogenase family)